MNWIGRIRKLLGGFWTRLFHASDFILWLENLLGMLSSRCQARQERWFAGMALSIGGKYQDRLPFVLLLRRGIYKDGVLHSLVGHPACSVLKVLTGVAGPGDLEENGGLAFELEYPVPEPVLITEHAVGSKHTLFGGIDFVYVSKDKILLYANPDELDWPTTRLSDADGNLVEYYRVFGWASATSAIEDAVAAFESPDLVSCAEAAWNVHQNGATVLAAKRLLSEACGAVTCAEDGEVIDMWSEANINCAVVGDRLYKSQAAPVAALHIGARMSAGDTLFGDFRCYPSGRVFPGEDELPGVHVMTEAGELFAANRKMQVGQLDGTSVLPLSGQRFAAYARTCVDLQRAGAPCIQIPPAVNPCDFILNVLRAGSYQLFLMATSALGPLSAALACVRRSAVASGMLRAYIRASGEPVSVLPASVSGSATVFRTAVAATVSVGIKNISTSTQVLI